MNANELADELETIEKEDWYEWMKDAATMLRQQQEQINNLQQWEKRQLDVIKAQEEYMKAQTEKIVDLAFKLAYAERSNEIVMKANTRSRP